MSEQLRLLPGLDPDALIAEAKERWDPIKTFCMFSGGNDSTAVAYRCRDHYDELFFIDTGTGVDEGDGGLSVISHVQTVAAELGKPLTIGHAGDAYENMVLGGGHIISRGRLKGEPDPGIGFPGPGMHGRAYNRLKERQIEDLKRSVKQGHHRNANVLMISGVRRDESAQRSKRLPLTETGSTKYVNPLIDWTRYDLLRYRQENGLPESDVAALAHMSGECLCGAFHKAGTEREMWSSLFPKTFGRIEALERKAEAQGFRFCRWGGFDLEGNLSTEVSAEETGVACTDCTMEMALQEQAA